MTGAMMDDQEEDALFARLAKTLEAVRRDAELVRSRGGEGTAEGLAQVQAELSKLAATIEALHQRFEQQDAVTTRLAAAAANGKADLEELRQAVDALSERVQAQDEVLSRSSSRRPLSRVAALIGVALVALALGGAAAWTASGREPSLGTLGHWLAVRLSALTGVRLAGAVEQAQPAATVADVVPGPQAHPAPITSAAPAAPDQPAVVTRAAVTSAVAPPQPAVAAAAPAGTQSATPTPPAQSVATSATSRGGAAASGEPSVAAPAPSAATSPSVDQAQAPAAAVTPPVAAAPPTRAEAAIQPAASAASAGGGSDAQTAATTASTPPSSPPPPVHSVVLRATANTWVRVRQEHGAALFTRNMKTGDTWTVPDEPGLVLDTGNANGLDVEVDGVVARLAGAKGGVLRDVALDGNLLGSGSAVRVAR